MSTAEFPRPSDDDALLRLARAVLEEAHGGGIEQRHRALADRYAPLCGFEPASERARSGLGAFLDDLLTHDGPRDVPGLVLAFSGWVGDGTEAAAPAEFGWGANEPLKTWMERRMGAVAAVLWEDGPGAPERCDAPAGTHAPARQHAD